MRVDGIKYINFEKGGYYNTQFLLHYKLQSKLQKKVMGPYQGNSLP
jgi:hypothetical protein